MSLNPCDYLIAQSVINLVLSQFIIMEETLQTVIKAVKA